MDPFTIGIAIGAAVLLLLTQGGCPPGAELAEPEDKDFLAITEWKKTAEGLARYFKAAFIPSIAVQLPSFYVVKTKDVVYKNSRVIVYTLYQGKAPDGQTAADIAKIAYNAGAAVFLSGTAWLPKAGKPVLMAIVPYQFRSAWSKCGRAWAIEFDNQAGEQTPPITRTTPPKGQGGSTTSAVLFDSNMTAQEQQDAAAMLNRSDLAPEFYDAQAIAAETPGHGGTNHGTHPKCAALMRARAAELRALTKIPAKKDPYGKIPSGDGGQAKIPADVVPPTPKVIDGITYDSNCSEDEIALARPLFARNDIKPDEYPPVIYAAENCDKHGPHPALAAQLKVKMAQQQLLYPGGEVTTNDDDGGGDIFGPWQG